MGRTSAINAKVHATKVCRNFTLRTRPIQNTCFVAFRKVWVHLGSFRYCTKLGEKWAELVQLMQKFMPRSCAGTFHYEHTRSTPLESKLILFAFRKVWVHLGSFRYCTKLGAKWAELVQLMQK